VYDPLNRLTNASANGSPAAGYGYDLAGNLQAMRYGNGVTNLCQYDSLNRLTNAAWKLNAGSLASFYYQLGLTGNRTSVTEGVYNGVSLIGRTNQWQYDPLYRLTNEIIKTASTGTLGYGYDAVGNRTSRMVSNLGLAGQTLAYNTNDWLKTDAYDSNGNTLWSTNGSVLGPYGYDVQNRLTNYNNSVYLGYDGDGNRVWKTVGGATTFYLVDDRNPSGYAQVLEEWTATGGTTNLGKVYNYGLSLISQRAPNSSTNYFISDGHGSTRLLTDAGGNFVNSFAYDAYGSLIASNGAAQTVYLYCGQQLDPDLGLYYNRARYLDANTGRFWTSDTYSGNNEDPLSLHKYLYCHNDPVDGWDPSGNDFELGGMLGAMDFGGILAQISNPVATRVQQRAQQVAGAVNRLSSKSFWEAYKQVNYDTFPPEKNVEVWKTVGGNIGKKFGPVAENSCATRVSWGLNYGGFPIPKGTSGAWHNFPDQSYEGKKGDDKYYIINAGNMNAFLKSKWGAPDFPQVADVSQLNSIITGLTEGQCAIFATRQSPGHSGALKKGYQDPYVEGELPLDVWKLGVP